MAANYTGPVFVVTGQQDALFCGNGNRHTSIPDCGSGSNSQISAVKTLYPAASNFDYFAQQDSGMIIMFIRFYRVLRLYRSLLEYSLQCPSRIPCSV